MNIVAYATLLLNSCMVHYNLCIFFNRSYKTYIIFFFILKNQASNHMSLTVKDAIKFFNWNPRNNVSSI
ncbi:hypothetical protein SAMN05720781_2435 [Fibrobacter sp. UWT3]|nr:hypothetical protein SAMN05720781_2435 [Fibrobacter sp. UWT3]